jgi:hypothetical protein
MQKNEAFRTMKTRLSCRTIAVGIGMLIILLSLMGCATPRIAADRPSIEKLDKIGVFAWQTRPFYNRYGGTGGTVGNLSDSIMTIYRATTGETQKKIQAIYDSGVYEAFENELALKFSQELRAKVQKLDKTKYLLNEKQKVDVIATSKAQGYDAVLEAHVMPVLLEKEDQYSFNYTSQNSLIIQLQLQRVSDQKILWMDAYNVSYKKYTEWNELSREAAGRAVRMYHTPGN